MRQPARDEALSGPFAAVQRDVLELIAEGAPFERVLDRLATGVESLLGEGLVTIQVVDGTRLRNVAAPSIPPDFLTSIADFPITPGLGSCLAAAAAGAPVIVDDIATSPNWQGHAHLATDHDLHACWSTPVVAPDGQVIGTFAVYYRRPTSPPPEALGIVAAASAMASIVMRHEAAQHALRVSEERFRQMAATIDECFWLQDATTLDVLYVSPAFERMWGIPSEALYADAKAAVALALPEDRALVQAALATPSERGDAEFRIRRPDGSVRWFHGRRLPVFDGDGQLIRLVGVVRDVTARKQLEQHLLQAQRVETLGTLASGIAHDLNNVLTPIMMAASSLHEEQPPASRAALVDIIERSATRGAALVQQVLAFARGAEDETRPVDRAEIVTEVVRLVRDTAARNIEVHTDLPSDLPAVDGNATQLHQVVLNLVVNARDAMPSGGVLTVTAQPSGPPGGLSVPAPVPPFVRLSVSDTGAGIPSDAQDRIFDAFFTTKPPGRGSGLGLSTVLTVVRRHGGHVTVDSELGRGSTFHVFLPATRERAENRPPATTVERRPDRRVRVLVVDDEAAIREVSKVGLTRLGYEVYTAASGDEALATLTRLAGRVDFALLDVMMPGMDGVTLAHEIRARFPALPLAAATGLPSDELRQRLREAGVAECLAKPYDAARLRRAIEAHVGPHAVSRDDPSATGG